MVMSWRECAQSVSTSYCPGCLFLRQMDRVVDVAVCCKTVRGLGLCTDLEELATVQFRCSCTGQVFDAYVQWW